MLDGEKRKRDQICTWENYDWKLPKPIEGNKYTGTGITEFQIWWTQTELDQDIIEMAKVKERIPKTAR